MPRQPFAKANSEETEVKEQDVSRWPQGEEGRAPVDPEITYDPSEFADDFVPPEAGESVIKPAKGLVATTCADFPVEINSRLIRGWRRARKGAGHILNEDIFIEKDGYLYHGDGAILVTTEKRYKQMREYEFARWRKWRLALNAPTQGIGEEFEETSDVKIGFRS